MVAKPFWYKEIQPMLCGLCYILIQHGRGRKACMNWICTGNGICKAA
jgi:hypothetical protein